MKPKSQSIDKLPSLCPTPDQLNPGDIIIFSRNPNQSSNPIASSQVLLNNSGGHKDTVHVGYIVEVEGVKKVAHVLYRGFVLDELDSLKTTCHVYRPRVHQQEIAAELNRYIQENKDVELKKVKWRFWVSFMSYTHRMISALGIKNSNTHSAPVMNAEALPTRRQYMSTSTICSKFVAESYVGSCYNLSKADSEHYDFRHDLMNIGVNTVPKTLQSYLYRCSNYEFLVLPSVKARNRLTRSLLDVIKKEIVGIRNRADIFSNAAMDKANQLEAIVNHFEYMKLPNGLLTPQQDFEFAQKLLEDTLPTLKINTGANLVHPTSYLNVMKVAKRVGLYDHYFKNDLKFNVDSTSLVDVAKQAYGYDGCKAELYSDCRRKGFSDEEARFECDPSLSGWLLLNKRRNAVAAMTVLPFLFFSLPYGMYVVGSAEARNSGLRHQSARAVEPNERSGLLLRP